MAPKDSRRPSSNQTGSKTSRGKPPTTGESVRQSTEEIAEQNLIQIAMTATETREVESRLHGNCALSVLSAVLLTLS